MERRKGFSVVFSETTIEEIVYSMDQDLNEGRVVLERRDGKFLGLRIFSRTGDEIMISDMTALKALYKVLGMVFDVCNDYGS